MTVGLLGMLVMFLLVSLAGALVRSDGRLPFHRQPKGH